ncbi:hypothetical protein H072_5470 [Dactylellina haptotyla CBS 200.50]|uniref:F-box domain-containing protein n=1 Tax=Dactylellina haptotyla (strain CBS 200.50) TaxID=1284197 RepID=S8BMF3_DACHA|nr:hypothetical protein H072_5470 [Dactylellina haptotyla CBS 200.50]
MYLLPVELQQQIIQRLDPIGLISLSHTCRRLRHLISPGRGKIVEWLIALESRRTYGPPIYHKTTDGTVEPDWNIEKWEASRWACTACLQMLPHIAFDNHSLLKLAYRKPDSGSSASTELLTSWVPTLRGKKWGKQERLARANEQKQSAQYNPDKPCGYKRWRRRCNECLYQAGLLGPQISHWGGYMGGTRKLPIRRSRLLNFQSPLDRWFPGIAEFLENKPPSFIPRVFRPMRWNTADEPWTMYMVRCPSCERWQELRMFRFGATYVNWKPSHNGLGELEYWATWQGGGLKKIQFDEISCSSCFAAKSGRDAMEQELLEWFDVPAFVYRLAMEARLNMPSCRLHHPNFKIPQYHKELRKLLREMAAERKAQPEALRSIDVATLHLRHHHFRELWERVKENEPHHSTIVETGSEYFTQWLYNFHEAEAHWQWIAAVQKEVRANPGILADWALSRNPESLR